MRQSSNEAVFVGRWHSLIEMLTRFAMRVYDQVLRGQRYESLSIQRLWIFQKIIHLSIRHSKRSFEVEKNKSLLRKWFFLFIIILYEKIINKKIDKKTLQIKNIVLKLWSYLLRGANSTVGFSDYSLMFSPKR